MSNFAFLQPEWPLFFEAATKAEGLANADARASCFYARRTLELAVAWMYAHDQSLRRPYQDNLSAFIHEPSFKATVGDALFTKARLIKDLGNLAVHSTRKVASSEAVNAIRSFCAEKGLPDPMIVDSGGGIHCYWPLTKTVGPRTWNLMATMLKAAFKEAALLVDPSRTSDMSSVLRPVGSHNRKPGREVREVKVKNTPTFAVPEELFKQLKEITQFIEVPQINKYAAHVGLNDDLTAHLATLVEASADFELVKAGCKVVSWASDPSNQNNVEEPLWRGLLGVVKFCAGASQLANQVSAHHRKYDADETEQKLEGWTAGPTTCGYFASYKPDLCRVCKHIEEVAA